MGCNRADLQLFDPENLSQYWVLLVFEEWKIKDFLEIASRPIVFYNKYVHVNGKGVYVLTLMVLTIMSLL